MIEAPRHPVSRRALLRKAGFGAGALALATPLLAADPTVTLRMSLPTGEVHPTNQTFTKFAAMVEQRSGGSLKIEIYLNGSLAKEQPSITGLQTGTVDLTCQTSAYIQSLAPKVQVLDLPFLFTGAEKAERILGGPIGRDVFNDLAQQGILGLAWGTNGWRELEFRDRPVAHPDDMKGLRMRIQAGPVYVSMMKALGAIPVVIDFAEAYISLSQKAIDGLDIPLPTVLSAKLYEVTKNIAMTNHLYNPSPLLMSKQRFYSLTPAQRQAIESSAHDIVPTWLGIFNQWQSTAVAELRAKGVTIGNIDHAAFRKAMNPVYAEYRDKVGASFFDTVMRAAS